ncbi:uncharacterized protein Dwil_GK12012 [Drosophila willistoni]|uniref:Uncharacterized protein n=1 Tax=Drosophila willistoni TaxID=7260 RepID=B4N886_DROWI|nr:uncharacterized protein LOC6648021 [Drosophila willistoni]EDW81337.1 uncharacterized protein Dwil_GK12012 [Drosophila willistoni]
MAENLQTTSIAPNLRPWEILAWSPERITAMYTDWGSYFSRQQRFAHGGHYVNKALDISPNNTKALMKSSQFKRALGLAPEALQDSDKAEKLLERSNPPVYNPHVGVEVCDALHECNRFEDAKINLHNHLRRYSTSTGQTVAVENRLNVVDENFIDTLGVQTSPAVQRLINNMTYDLANQKPKESKPECDVVSILEMEEELVSPLELARRRRHFKIYNQTYLNRCWVDVAFLKKLRNSPHVFLENSSESTPYIKNLIKTNYKATRVLTKMLHARCPMYATNMHKYASGDLYNKHQEDNLFRIQYQTRRNMFKILRSIRHLIKVGELNKLTHFVEEVMGEYVSIKTNRVMPWKFEFINEVYNYLGLARINEYKIPSDMKVLQGKQRLLTLFKLPLEKNLELTSKAKVANILQLTKTELSDPKAELFKKRIAHLEYRMRFAKYPIERGYLLHEMAQAHLDNNTFDAACSIARKAMDEAKKCNSNVWTFLSLIIIGKADAVLGKIEREKEILTEAFSLAKRLKNLDLCLFIDICLKVNAEEMDLKKSIISTEINFKRLKSSQSRHRASADPLPEL